MSRKPNPDSPLVQAMLKAGLSQTEVSERTGINPARVSRYANGLQVPSPQHLQLLAELLEAPAASLLHPEGVLR